MRLGDRDTVLVIVGVGRILHEPGLAAQDRLYGADILARRLCALPFETLVLLAERARRISFTLRRGEKFCDVLIVFFGFGQIDRDLQRVLPVVVSPYEIFFDGGLLDIAVAHG